MMMSEKGVLEEVLVDETLEGETGKSLMLLLLLKFLRNSTWSKNQQVKQNIWMDLHMMAHTPRVNPAMVCSFALHSGISL